MVPDFEQRANPHIAVRRAKVHNLGGCEPHPANVVPGGSNRNGRGGNEGERGRRPLGIPTIRDIRRHGVLDVSTTTDERALPDAVAGLLADCKSAFADAVASLCNDQ